jgi:deoxycytidylate deaminase
MWERLPDSHIAFLLAAKRVLMEGVYGPFTPRPTRSELYTTTAPCLSCAKLIINAGIRLVVFRERYRDPAGLDLLIQARVQNYAFES